MTLKDESQIETVLALIEGHIEKLNALIYPAQPSFLFDKFVEILNKRFLLKFTDYLENHPYKNISGDFCMRMINRTLLVDESFTVNDTIFDIYEMQNCVNALGQSLNDVYGLTEKHLEKISYNSATIFEDVYEQAEIKDPSTGEIIDWEIVFDWAPHERLPYVLEWDDEYLIEAAQKSKDFRGYIDDITTNIYSDGGESNIIFLVTPDLKKLEEAYPKYADMIRWCGKVFESYDLDGNLYAPKYTYKGKDIFCMWEGCDGYYQANPITREISFYWHLIWLDLFIKYIVEVVK